jgi:hypothetical protein
MYGVRSSKLYCIAPRSRLRTLEKVGAGWSRLEQVGAEFVLDILGPSDIIQYYDPRFLTEKNQSCVHSTQRDGPV